jgi:hypothetical protein
VNLRIGGLRWRRARRRLVAPSIVITRFEQLAWDGIDILNRDDRIDGRPAVRAVGISARMERYATRRLTVSERTRRLCESSHRSENPKSVPG